MPYQIPPRQAIWLVVGGVLLGYMFFVVVVNILRSGAGWVQSKEW